MRTIRAESTVRPPEIDYTSSPDTVYVSKNIATEEREGQTYYLYDKDVYSKDEYETLMLRKLQEENADLEGAILELSMIISVMMIGGMD